MAEWKYACKTAQGMNLDLKLFGRGLTLELTKSMSGAGRTSPTQLMRLQDIIDPVQELEILDAVERLEENVIRLPVILKNKYVMEKYDMHQLGIYAEDPDVGEILYIVLQSDSAEEIPSYEEMKDFTLQWYLNMSVGNTQDVTVVIDETGVLTTEQADARYVSSKGDASQTTVIFETAKERENIESKEPLSTIFGKIRKYLSDLKTVAFTGSYNDLANKPAIPAAVRVKGNAETAYRTGDVNITPANIGLGNVGNFKAVSTGTQTLSAAEKSNARTNIGAAPISHASAETAYGTSSAVSYGHAMASSTTPKANGAAAIGTETAKFARGDHVHPLQTSVTGSSGSCTGNAATATKATKDGNGNIITDTYETKAGNTWKKIKTIAYNGSATAGRNVYKELKIVAYRTVGNGAVVYGIYDFPTSILDNVADNPLYFSDTSVMDAYFYATLNGNTVIVENSYKGMTIELYGK